MSAELAGHGGAEGSPERDFANWRLGLAKNFAGGGQLDAGGSEAARDLGARPCEGLAALSARAVPPDALERERRKWHAELAARAADGWKIELFFHTEAAPSGSPRRTGCRRASRRGWVR
jgi:hypothetical protein